MVLLQAKVLDPMHLELARPIEASCGDTLLIVITESPLADADRRQWLEGSLESLRDSYGSSERDYPLSMLREANPGFGA